MAGEIAQDVAIMVALSSAAIGASGAVASQIVAGLITGRRELRKANAEAERWKYESDAKRRDRQFDRKIKVFSQFLSTSGDMTDTFRRPGDSITEAIERVLNGEKQLNDLTEEISILAPELYELANSAVESASILYLLYLTAPHIGATREGLSEAELAERRQDNEKYQREIQDTKIGLRIWSDLFRLATRAYVNHEPLLTHNELVAIHTAMVIQECGIKKARDYDL